MKKTLLTLFLLSTLSVFADNNDSILFLKNGKTDFYIQKSSPEAKKGALLLQSYLDSITDIKLVVSEKRIGNKHHFNFLPINKLKDRECADSIRYDGFVIKTEKGNINIYGKNEASFKNAVFYLLEHQFNCRYYTSEEITLPKTAGNFSIKNINTIQNPHFEVRISHNGSSYDYLFAEWHGLHNKPKVDGKRTGISDDWGLWVHTLHKLVPPSEYYELHPEYFALRNGVRVIDQLCLTNPEVLEICIENLRKKIEKNPTPKYWSVSQMDNFNYCECDNCKKVDEENGSHSGSMIAFVNEVAKEFPNKIISTLAYQYTRKTPEAVRPLSNVNIMLCSIECNRSKPIASDTSSNGFKADLENWSALTNNIIVWDYVINFSNIIGPFPNFQVLSPNLKLFEKNHINMIFEQGYPGYFGENVELRTYLLSKLMWNPNLDVDSLTYDFCLGYFGKGGRYIYDYLDFATRQLNKSEKDLTLYEPMSAHADGFLSPENITKYFMYFNRALEISSSEKHIHRIQIAMQPLRYAYLEIAKSLPYSSDWIFERNEYGDYVPRKKAVKILVELCEMAEKYGPSTFHETSIPPSEYYKKTKDYFENGIVKHKAVGKSITYSVKPENQYQATGNSTLVDGVRGTDNYFSLWQGWHGEDMNVTIDFDTVTEIRKVIVSTLANDLSWIFPASEIQVFKSDDGIVFQEIASMKNESAKSKLPKSIISAEVNLPKPETTRYLKVVAKNIGKMPEWRGIDDNAWIFVDEIIVQ